MVLFNSVKNGYNCFLGGQKRPSRKLKTMLAPRCSSRCPQIEVVSTQMLPKVTQSLRSGRQYESRDLKKIATTLLECRHGSAGYSNQKHFLSKINKKLIRLLLYSKDMGGQNQKGFNQFQSVFQMVHGHIFETKISVQERSEKVDVYNIAMPYLCKEFGALKLPELIRKTLIAAIPKCCGWSHGWPW